MPRALFRWGKSYLHAFRRIILVLGITSLGYVGYALLDAQLFQAYENRRFDNAVKYQSTIEAKQEKFLVTSPSKIEAPPLQVEEGSILGRVKIDRLGISIIILEGTDAKTLRRGVGHIEGTALPGVHGNVGLAGHRDTFFRPLRNIREGDQISLITVNGSYQYRVDSLTLVEPDDVAMLKDMGGSTLTLVTCYPFDYIGPAPRRFIVHANRI